MNKRFTNTKEITKANLKNIPSGKPGVFRIKDGSGEIWHIGMTNRDHLINYIEDHSRGLGRKTYFQYLITRTEKEAERLRKSEIRKSILLSIKLSKNKMAGKSKQTYLKN